MAAPIDVQDTAPVTMLPAGQAVEGLSVHPVLRAPGVDDATPGPATTDNPRRVVVLGGGVAGLTAAYELRRKLGRRAAVTLVSRTSHFLLGQVLLAVPFSHRADRAGFAIGPALRRRGIAFRQANVDRVDPLRRIVHADGEEISYDYLLIATGPELDGTAVSGIGGEFNAAYSIHAEQAAVETGDALRYFLDQPGPAVIGLAPGAAYLSAAYEFALGLDYALRQHGTRADATITFVTPEAHLGHLGTDVPGARRRLERNFARREIAVITGAYIQRVDHTHVILRDGTRLPASFTMVIPAFSGVPAIRHSPGLTDARGYVPVDAQFCHHTYPEVYAAGVAARLDVPAPVTGSLPKSGYLAALMARTAARNIAAAITWRVPEDRPLPRLRDLRILDGRDAGLLLVSAGAKHPVRLALPLPGRTAHWAKGMLTRYLIWKLRTGRTYLP